MRKREKERDRGDGETETRSEQGERERSDLPACFPPRFPALDKALFFTAGRVLSRCESLSLSVPPPPHIYIYIYICVQNKEASGLTAGRLVGSNEHSETWEEVPLSLFSLSLSFSISLFPSPLSLSLSSPSFSPTLLSPSCSTDPRSLLRPRSSLDTVIRGIIRGGHDPRVVTTPGWSRPPGGHDPRVVTTPGWSRPPTTTEVVPGWLRPLIARYRSKCPSRQASPCGLTGT